MKGQRVSEFDDCHVSSRIQRYPDFIDIIWTPCMCSGGEAQPGSALDMDVSTGSGQCADTGCVCTPGSVTTTLMRDGVLRTQGTTFASATYTSVAVPPADFISAFAVRLDQHTWACTAVIDN